MQLAVDWRIDNSAFQLSLAKSRSRADRLNGSWEPGTRLLTLNLTPQVLPLHLEEGNTLLMFISYNC